MSLYLKGLQSYRQSKFAVKKKLAENPSFIDFIELRIVIAGLREARVRYPAGPNFEGLQFCGPLTYKVM